MKKLLVFLCVYAIFTLLAPGCNTANSRLDGEVELYLLDSYQTSEEGIFHIDESTAITEDTPLLTYEDFISYNPEKFVFVISESARQKINRMEFPVNGLAFGITAGDELVYTGYFWPAYSSMICNWTIIDPIWVYSENKLKVKLGYPYEGESVPDKRNDQRILDIFRRDHKLIE